LEERDLADAQQGGDFDGDLDMNSDDNDPAEKENDVPAMGTQVMAYIFKTKFQFLNQTVAAFIFCI
jgi:hypothetical protein